MCTNILFRCTFQYRTATCARNPAIYRFACDIGASTSGYTPCSWTSPGLGSLPPDIQPHTERSATDVAYEHLDIDAQALEMWSVYLHGLQHTPFQHLWALWRPHQPCCFTVPSLLITYQFRGVSFSVQRPANTLLIAKPAIDGRRPYYRHRRRTRPNVPTSCSSAQMSNAGTSLQPA